MRCRREAGSVVPFVAVAVTICAMLLGGLARLGQAAVDRGRARNAADAAALAGAAEGEKAARQLAKANGGEVLRYQVAGRDTEVRVRVGVAEATGRARREGG